jgi:hypothetical protein
MRALRNALAVIGGAVVACVLAYVGAVIVLLVFFGLPLGAPGRDPTPTEYGLLMACAATAALVGGRTAARIAPSASRGVVFAVAAVLAVLMLWGFTGEGVQWPTWWAPTIAVAMGGGALLAIRRRPTTQPPAFASRKNG